MQDDHLAQDMAWRKNKVADREAIILARQSAGAGKTACDNCTRQEFDCPIGAPGYSSCKEQRPRGGA